MTSRLFIIIGFFSLFIKSNGQLFYENRKDIPEKYTWDLTTQYNSWSEWEQSLQLITLEIETMQKREDKFISSGIQLYKTMYESDSLMNALITLYVYAMMQRDLDQVDELTQKNEMIVSNLFSDLSNATAWINPCVLKLNKDSVRTWIKKTPMLKDYEHYYKKLLRDQEHVPAEEIEKILNLFNNGFHALSNAYDELFYTDIETPVITIGNGDTIKLTSVNLSEILRNNSDRVIRQKAYNTYTGKFCSKKNTCAALLNGNCEMYYGYSQAYKYNSTLEMFLYADSIPLSLYTDIIETVKSGTQAVQKYHKLRAQALKFTDYGPADRTYNIVRPDKKYSYDTAMNIIVKSLEPLGADYLKKLDYMLNQRRIDVYENEGKVSNMAYSVTTYGSNPYILMTYGDNLRDIYYLVHELGHAIHGMFATETQPLSNYESTIFIDEVTSTLNEVFLTDYLIKSIDNNDAEIFILQSAIENLEYYYWSTLKADYALQIFNSIEKGRPLTASYLDELYSSLNKEYFGNTISNFNPGGWTMYGNIDFYDYQYTSSIITSILFYNKIKNDPSNESINKYINLLKSGGNNYPIKQLKEVGIDITDKNNYKILGEYMAILVEQYEAALKKGGYLKH